MTAILREDPPDLERLEEKLSPSVARLVQHCLEKRPGERFQSARDLAFDLQSLASGGSASERSGRALPAVAPARGRRAVVAVSLVGAGLAAGFLLGALALRTSPQATPVLRPSFRQLTRAPGGEGSPTLSPDGENLVFVKRDGGDLDLFLQRVDGTKAIPLTADCDQDDFDPAFSPDGRSIAFRSDCGGGIFVIGATGESRRRITESGYAPAWSPDGRELAFVSERLDLPTSRNSTSELWVVNVESGQRRRVSFHDAMGPTWSPDGRRIAFWGLRGEGFQRDLWSVAADGSQSAPEAAVSILDDPALDWAPVWSHDGRWLYFASTRGGTFNLWRIPIEIADGRPRGEPEAITAPSSWAGPFALSADGRRLAFVDRNAETEILRAPYDVARHQLAGAPAPVFSGSFELREQVLSPDGGWILFTNEDPPQQLNLVRSDGTGYRQLTEGVDRNRQGSFSPKGDWIAFQTTRGSASLAAVRPDGGGWQSLPVGPGLSTPVWSPDGTTIAAYNNERGAFLFDVRAGVSAAVERLLPPVAPGVQFWPLSWSPDGSLLAGSVARAGQNEGIAVYSIARGDYREVPWGRLPHISFSIAFVDRERIAFSLGGELRLGEVIRGDTQLLYTAPAGRKIDNVSATLDGRWLSWIERADESDIWLMTLDDAKVEGGGKRP